MQLIRQYKEVKSYFSCLNNDKIINVYQLSIEEIQQHFFGNADVTFIKKTDNNFIFSFVPKKHWCFDSITKARYLSEPRKWLGAKYTKYIPINCEYIQIDDNNNFVKYGMLGGE